MKLIKGNAWLINFAVNRTNTLAPTKVSILVFNEEDTNKAHSKAVNILNKEKNITGWIWLSNEYIGSYFQGVIVIGLE